MSTPSPEGQLGVTVAIAWVMVWVIGFVALGINHAVARQPDSRSLFLVAGILAAFLASLWVTSSEPRSSVALASNVIVIAAVLLSAVLVSRNPGLMAIRWTDRGQRNFFLVASWVWVGLIWLSILGAGWVAEVHHVFRSRAR